MSIDNKITPTDILAYREIRQCIQTGLKDGYSRSVLILSALAASNSIQNPILRDKLIKYSVTQGDEIAKPPK